MAQKYDLFFRQAASERFVPLIIGAMVYLAALALAGSMAIGQVIETWSEDLRGTLTVQIPAGDPAAGGASAQINSALSILLETPGVDWAEPVPVDDINSLLRPWFGEAGVPDDLPLPALIEVQLLPGAELDAAKLGQHLDQAVPDAILFDNGAWLQHLVRFARSVQWVAGIVVALVGGTAIAIIVFATRAGLSVHRRTIELLHTIGAKDGYIARQFQYHSLRLGFAGGILGLAIAAVTLIVLAILAEQAGAGMLPKMSLTWEHLIVLGILPVASALIATLTARAIVMRALREMP
jgi:cell division transport system permease protein